MNRGQAETAHYTNTFGYGNKEILSWPNRGATGFSLKIIELTANFAFSPDNISIVSTSNFPVRYNSPGEIDPMRVTAMEAHHEAIKRSTNAAKRLEQHGCRAIIGYCGLLQDTNPM